MTPELNDLSPTGLRVLAVDDNADGVESLAMVLEIDGHAVRTAPDGPTALALVQQFQPQVALLDISLPGMSGHELAQRLRALPGGDRMFLVALTGWDSEAEQERSRAAGFDMHLTKPVNIDAFGPLFEQAKLRFNASI